MCCVISNTYTKCVFQKTFLLLLLIVAALQPSNWVGTTIALIMCEMKQIKNKAKLFIWILYYFDQFFYVVKFCMKRTDKSTVNCVVSLAVYSCCLGSRATVNMSNRLANCCPRPKAAGNSLRAGPTVQLLLETHSTFVLVYPY